MSLIKLLRQGSTEKSPGTSQAMWGLQWVGCDLVTVQTFFFPSRYNFYFRYRGLKQTLWKIFWAAFVFLEEIIIKISKGASEQQENTER